MPSGIWGHEGGVGEDRSPLQIQSSAAGVCNDGSPSASEPSASWAEDAHQTWRKKVHACMGCLGIKHAQNNTLAFVCNLHVEYLITLIFGLYTVCCLFDYTELDFIHNGEKATQRLRTFSL